MDSRIKILPLSSTSLLSKSKRIKSSLLATITVGLKLIVKIDKIVEMKIYNILVTMMTEIKQYLTGTYLSCRLHRHHGINMLPYLFVLA